MRRTIASLGLVLLAAACTGPAPAASGPAPSGGSPSQGASSPDARRIGIYAAAFRALAETERWFDPILLDERICPRVADPMAETGGACRERFTEEEQAAILERLADLGTVRFVPDGEGAMRRIFRGDLRGAGLLTVGPIEGDGSRVEVAGRAYCGVLCAHWMTWVVERTPAGWEVTGTTGPVAIS